MVDEGLDQDPLTPAAGTMTPRRRGDLGGEAVPCPERLHLERSTDGLDTVGEPPQPRPMPGVGPAHAVVLDGPIQPSPAVTDTATREAAACLATLARASAQTK